MPLARGEGRGGEEEARRSKQLALGLLQGRTEGSSAGGEEVGGGATGGRGEEVFKCANRPVSRSRTTMVKTQPRPGSQLTMNRVLWEERKRGREEEETVSASVKKKKKEERRNRGLGLRLRRRCTRTGGFGVGGSRSRGFGVGSRGGLGPGRKREK